MRTRQAARLEQSAKKEGPFALPNELWTQALEYLNKADLKSVRLCGQRHLEILASRLLFTTAYVAARVGVLETFSNMTSHPVLNAYINEVIFDYSSIEPEIVSLHENDTCGPSLAAMLCQQDRIMKDEIHQRLDNGLRNLPALKRVRYADLSRISCLPGDCNDPTAEKEYHDGPLLWRSESLKAPDDDEARFQKQQSSLTKLIEVLSMHATSTLTDLTLGGNVHACGDGGVNCGFFSPNFLIRGNAHFFSVFRCLRKLDLTISMPKLSTGPMVLAEILKSAQQLEELKLVVNRNSENTIRFNLEDTMADYTWSNLRTVYLSGLSANQGVLEGVLKRHASSLRYLTLDIFNLTDGTWKDFGSYIKTMNPELQCILGQVADKGKWSRVDLYLELVNLDISGPKIVPQTSCEGEIELEGELDEEEIDDDSNSDNLSYSSDDSSSETDEPRREPDADLLTHMDASLRRKVDYLLAELPGIPIQECQKALEVCPKQQDAWLGLKRKFGYDDLEAMNPDMRVQVEKLLDEMPFDCSVSEVKDALEKSDCDPKQAKKYLRQCFGYRQKIVMR